MQRPRVLASVGLDLYVMRQVAAAVQGLPSVRGPALAALWSARAMRVRSNRGETLSDWKRIGHHLGRLSCKCLTA